MASENPSPSDPEAVYVPLEIVDSDEDEWSGTQEGARRAATDRVKPRECAYGSGDDGGGGDGTRGEGESEGEGEGDAGLGGDAGVERKACAPGKGARSRPESAAGEERHPARTTPPSSPSPAPATAASPPPAPPTPAAESVVSQLKERGNEAVKGGDLRAAREAYLRALEALEALEGEAGEGSGGGGGGPPGPPGLASRSAPSARAVVASNLAHVLVGLGEPIEAERWASHAAELAPSWHKPHLRLASAHEALGRWAAAVGAGMRALSLSRPGSEEAAHASRLLDRLATTAAEEGDLSGYPGRQLEVRAAGDDAWLGGPAPYDPALDGPEDEDGGGVPARALAGGSAGTLPGPGAGEESPRESRGASAPGGSNRLAGRPGKSRVAEAGELVAWNGGRAQLGGPGPGRAGDLAMWRHDRSGAARRSFRSLNEAVRAARDGDRIVLRRGTHNGMGESVVVKARILVVGEGEVGETVLDSRGNSPALRFSRGGATVSRLVVDQTGFREAVLAAGPAAAPLLKELSVRCSGDDAVCARDGAVPRLVGCSLGARKVGLRCWSERRPAGRAVRPVGGAGLRAGAGAGFGAASAPRPALAPAPTPPATLLRCTFDGCEDAAVLVGGSAAVELEGCALLKSLQGVVVMDDAWVSLQACAIEGCKGPAVDVSGRGSARVSGGRYEGNVGGIWAWDNATVTVEGSSLDGGSSYALVADDGRAAREGGIADGGRAGAQGAETGKAARPAEGLSRRGAAEGLSRRGAAEGVRVRVAASRVTGSTFGAQVSPAALEAAGCQLLPAGRHTGWPVPDEPFTFVPDPYTRKM